MFVRVASAAVVGIEAAPIDVEVDVGVGLPCCNIVGLADAGIREGRVRIRGALENSGFKLPPRRITVNLAPADLRKDGAAFDVPIAVGMLAARASSTRPRSTERCSSASSRSTGRSGPCAACCRLPPGRGPAASAGSWSRPRTPARPRWSRAVTSGAAEPERAGRACCAASRATPPAPRAATAAPPALASGADLTDVRGQEVPRRALEIAAAGGTTCCSSAHRAPGRRCSPPGSRASCRRCLRRGAGDDDGLLDCRPAGRLVAAWPRARSARPITRSRRPG